MTLFDSVLGRWALIMVAVAGSALPLQGGPKNKAGKSLEQYLQQLPQLNNPAQAPTSPGSLWTNQGRLADLATDYKAHRVGDLVTILVLQSLQAENTGNVSSDRSFKASSGIDALAGRIKTGGVQNIFSPTSSQSLAGKAQSASTSSLKTSLTGQVVAVLPGGSLVVEAQREILMNNEKQTILIRGLVRPGDLAPDNSVASNAIGHLELELKGKGVVSDGTRPPNTLTRWLLRLVGF
jgi:flagellar L-ring protein precursor FlgH